MANIEEKVESLISKTITDLGYELYDVIYEKEAQDNYLRVFIDTPKGISLNDCEKVNDAINDLLDTADYIKDQYFLEVSSPGVERLLRKDKHLEVAIDSEITCNLFSPVSIDNTQNNQEDKKESENSSKDEECKSNKDKSSKKKKKTKKEASFKQLEGTLKNFDKDKIEIEVEVDNDLYLVEIPRKNIANIRLKYNWQ